MAGRKHRSRPGKNRREVSLTRDGGSSLHRSIPSADEHLLRRRPPSPSSSPSALQDRIAAQNREIQSLLLDNQRMAATHVALKQELNATQQDIRLLSSAAAEVKVQRDIEVRGIYEKSLKMDAEVRAIEAMNSDLVQVRADIQELIEARKDLASHLQAIESDLARVREEANQVPTIKADIETMRHEIQRGRYVFASHISWTSFLHFYQCSFICLSSLSASFMSMRESKVELIILVLGEQLNGILCIKWNI